MLVSNTDVLSEFLLVSIFKFFLYKASEKEKIMKLQMLNDSQLFQAFK